MGDSVVTLSRRWRLRAQAKSAVWLLAFCVSPLVAQQPRAFHAEYTVALKDPAAQLFHVTATFNNLRQPQLDLALPIWTPGWYTLEYYAKNVSRLTVTDAEGRRLEAPLSRAQTWSIDTRGLSRIVVEFDYHATVLAPNQAKITATYAFFTGTQLFLEPVGHRDASPTVRFALPGGWGIVSALSETPDPNVYTALDYDDLVDSPTWFGAFALRRFVVEGKTHLFAFDATLRFSEEDMRRYLENLATMVRTASAIFGGLPYDKYVFFQLPDSAESSAAGSALEHANSYVGCCGGPKRLTVGSSAAHEFFHAWNVKRIRPAELWPYDYARPVETPSLWMSEGVTDYYGLLIAYRAGFTSESQLLASLNSGITRVEDNPARAFMSPSDASMATWRAYLQEPVSYYTTGAVLGALLDLSILHDTHGQRGLDDVMRILFSEFYKRKRGFTPLDLERMVGSVAGRDYHAFFQRFVAGTDVPPYNEILAYAGIRRTAQTFGVLNAITTPIAGGRRVDALLAGGLADKAGLRTGDVLVALDDVPIERVGFRSDGCCVLERAGQRVVFTAVRDSARLQIPIVLGTLRESSIEPDPRATAEQIVVRRAWLAKQ